MSIKKHCWGLKYGFRWWLATSLLPSVPSRHIRIWGLKKMGLKMKGDMMIYSGFHIREPQKITIGKGEQDLQNYQQAVDEAWNAANLSVVAFVYNDRGVMQVTKGKVIMNNDN